MMNFIESTCSNFGWHKFDRKFLNISNNIPCAVYAFTISDSKPDDKILPSQLEEVFYIGQTGGHDDDIIIDCKKKDGKKPRTNTTFHRRMKDHRSERGKLSQCLSKHFFLKDDFYVFVAQPKPNIRFIKSWLLKVESDLIYEYSLMYNDIPILNDAHKSNRKFVSERYKHSNAQKIMQIRKKSSTLDQFLS